MSNKHYKKKNPSIILKLLLILVLVLAFCVGAILLVINFTGNDKKLSAPTVMPTQTPIQATLKPSEKPEKTEKNTTSEKPLENSSAPSFSSVSASSSKDSVKTEKGIIKYTVSNLTDNDKETTWTPSEDDSTPFVKFSSKSKQTVSGFTIENGYSKNENLYAQNNRAKKIQITVDDDEFEYTLQDLGCGIKQTVYLPEKTTTTKIEIKFISFYKGTKYNDLCITEIEPF